MLLIMDLMARFPVKLFRNEASKRPSACSTVTEALAEEGLKRGGEQAIRKIWERYGPPAVEAFRARGPKPGVVRFTSHDM